MLVNENMIKYELISKSKNLTIMPSDSEIAIESLNKWKFKCCKILWTLQKKNI